MNIKSDIEARISIVIRELEEQIDQTSREATNILRLHNDKQRFHMNAGTMESEEYLKSEEDWNTINQKLKTLEQIKLIIEPYRNESGDFKDLEELNKTLQDYIELAEEKELNNIAKIFREYKAKLPKEESQIEELIKLKIKPESNSQYIKEIFLKACHNLDASIFEPLIDEDQYFEELDKYRFLQSMKEQFDYLKENGAEKVHLVIGTCKMCYTGEKVYEFYREPNNGKPAFSYNIQEENGSIKDIFRCNFSDGYERDARNNTNPDITYLF